jgi:hemoglobin
MIEKYGRVKIRQIVSHFYGAVLKSPRLSPYFDGVDVHGLMAHQSAFLAAVMGAEQSHEMADIERAHHGLGVDAEDFAEMLDLLEDSLKRFEVEEDDRHQIIGRYRAFQGSVVGAGSESSS